MKDHIGKTALLIALIVPFSASADPIEIVPLNDGNHPATLGGYVMTPFEEPTGTSDCTPSTSGGEVCFEDVNGNSIALPAESPWWWEYDGSPAPDHGNVFVVRGENWIDLILPADTRAFSLFVGANSRGSAWIQAFDDQGNSTDRVNFGVGRNDTDGYGVFTTGCTALTRITVEPFEWGFGYLSSNQGECTSVSEPTPVGLLGLGLLGLVLTRRLQLKRPKRLKLSVTSKRYGAF